MKRLVAISIFLFVMSSQITNAAPHANLLAEHNPSFEEGAAHWAWSTGSQNLLIIENHSSSACGNHFARAQKEDGYYFLISDAVRFHEDGLYKFSIRARVQRKLDQKPVIRNIYAHMLKADGSGPLYSIGKDITTTNGQWMTFQGTFQTNKAEHPRVGFWIEVQMKRGGKVDFDCAKINRVDSK